MSGDEVEIKVTVEIDGVHIGKGVSVGRSDYMLRDREKGIEDYIKLLTDNVLRELRNLG